MSHLTRVRTTLTDSTLLAAALRAVGYPDVEVHDQPQRLHSRWGWSADAEVIVRPGADPRVRHDFGFARNADGSYELMIDNMERSRHDAGWMSRLSQAYGHAATLRYADANGFEVVTDEMERDGTRRLTLRRHA